MPSTTCCSTSTIGKRRAEIRATLKLVRFDVQSPPPLAFPLAASGLGFGPAVCVPFSLRVQPGWAMMIEPSCVVNPSK